MKTNIENLKDRAPEALPIVCEFDTYGANDRTFSFTHSTQSHSMTNSPSSQHVKMNSDTRSSSTFTEPKIKPNPILPPHTSRSTTVQRLKTAVITRSISLLVDAALLLPLSTLTMAELDFQEEEGDCNKER